MTKQALNQIGWAGVVLILIAYALISFQIVTADSIIYHVLNIGGSIAIIIEAGSKKDYQPTVLNIIWMLIALIALLRIFI